MNRSANWLVVRRTADQTTPGVPCALLLALPCCFCGWLCFCLFCLGPWFGFLAVLSSASSLCTSAPALGYALLRLLLWLTIGHPWSSRGFLSVWVVGAPYTVAPEVKWNKTHEVQMAKCETSVNVGQTKLSDGTDYRHNVRRDGTQK